MGAYGFQELHYFALIYESRHWVLAWWASLQRKELEEKPQGAIPVLRIVSIVADADSEDAFTVAYIQDRQNPDSCSHLYLFQTLCSKSRSAWIECLHLFVTRLRECYSDRKNKRQRPLLELKFAYGENS